MTSKLSQISENGTQYDRYGAFWIGGVELLRTTTAEPTPDGIIWTVEKDITRYADYLLNPNVATLSIPNNVDSTYTGIPLVTISVTFYESDSDNPSPLAFPEIIPLANSPGDWSSLGVSDGSSLQYQSIITSNDIYQIELDLLASPHGCEEFWYTNIDNDTLASELGLCGGGVYRELQVYVDDRLAGAVNPYFVLYTGGINPYLWRPLTGIMSFDIPAYKFDLTPLGLNDGKVHNITVRVEGGDSQGGVWYLDSSLVIYHNSSLAPIVVEFLDSTDNGSQVFTESGATSEGYSWITKGSHKYSTRGIMKTGTGKAYEYKVVGFVETSISNMLTDSASTQVTTGLLNTQLLESREGDITSDRGLYSQTIFPFHINSSYYQDDTTFDIAASIEMSYRRIFADTDSFPTFSSELMKLGDKFPMVASLWSNGGEASPNMIQWNNNLASSAQYNRTLDHTTVYIQTDTAHGNYRISSFANSDYSTCYIREVTAVDGDVINDKHLGDCSLPNGKYICGYDLCQGNPTQSYHQTFSYPSNSDQKWTINEPKLSENFPFRHPLMGSKSLHEVTILHPPK